LKWVSVVGGTSGNAFVQHPNAGEFGDVVIHPEFTNPPEHHASIVERFDDWPAKEAPAADLVKRTADVAIEYAIGELEPDVLMVWFPEPDTSQHAFGVDSSEAQEMYTLADRQLRRILEAIRALGDEPDVFVVSDHGYSTIDSVIDVNSELVNAGFNSNSIVIAENGGSLLLYLTNTKSELVDGLLNWLVAREWVDAIATDLPNSIKREFASIDELGIAGPRAPHIAIAMRSTDTGLPAPLARSGATAGGRVGVGSHGGGSSAELHNTLIASGPSFVSGLHSELPSGNIDIAPTVLELLGIPLPEHFDGRVLHEALESGHELESSLAAQSVSRSSSITSVTVGDTRYLCEFG